MLLKALIVIALIALVVAPLSACQGQKELSETQELPEAQGPETVTFPDGNLVYPTYATFYEPPKTKKPESTSQT